MGRCRSWWQLVPIKRPRTPRNTQGMGFACGVGPLQPYEPTPYPGPGHAYWLKYCAPAHVQRQFDVGGPEAGTLVGARKVPGLFDPTWGVDWSRATPSTFDPTRPYLKLPGFAGWWAPPGIHLPQQKPARDTGHVTALDAHPLLSGRLYDLLCKAPTITYCAFDGKTWDTSQNRGVTKDEAVARDRLRRGWHVGILDTVALARRLGHVASDGEEVGACGDPDNFSTPARRVFGAGLPAVRGAQPTGVFPRTPAVGAIGAAPVGAPPLPGAPAAPAPSAPGAVYLDCVRAPFGYAIGAHVRGYAGDPQIAAVYGKFPWT